MVACPGLKNYRIELNIHEVWGFDMEKGKLTTV